MTAAMVELVGRAQHGDTDAYGLIYQRYRREVYHIVHARVRNHDVAEDLTQDTFVRALKAFRRDGGFMWQDKDLGAWLGTIARRLTIDHYKKAENRLATSTATFDGHAVIDVAVEGDPEAAVVERRRDVALVNALAELSEDQREAVINRYLRDMSVAETAAAMGKNEAAVKSLTYRAVRSIGRQFNGSWR